MNKSLRLDLIFHANYVVTTEFLVEEQQFINIHSCVVVIDLGVRASYHNSPDSRLVVAPVTLCDVTSF